MIGIAPILDYRLSRKLEEIAKGENIPFQLEVMNGSTGTDANSIAGRAAASKPPSSPSPSGTCTPLLKCSPPGTWTTPPSCWRHF